VRSRQRKKTYQEELEQTISNQNALIESLSKSKNELQQKNAAFSSENKLLK
jgi:fructose-specific phosphotransferase system component IIB